MSQAGCCSTEKGRTEAAEVAKSLRGGSKGWERKGGVDRGASRSRGSRLRGSAVCFSLQVAVREDKMKWAHRHPSGVSFHPRSNILIGQEKQSHLPKVTQHRDSAQACLTSPMF